MTSLPLPQQPRQQNACIVMVDLVRSTDLASHLSLRDYTTLMSEFVQVMMLGMERHGGQVLQHQGDAVLAYWEPQDAAQAVDAALGAQERTRQLSNAQRLGLRLDVRSAVAEGEIILGWVGTQLTAYGLPVNLACRLCKVAEPGETLVCQRVYEQCAPEPRPLTLPPLGRPGSSPEAVNLRLSAADTAARYCERRIPRWQGLATAT
ncbi:adenylate/guanylate cyclase domain-containing protein [Deinococcus lacus]|uniref:Adenylate/guanylate cyclase domain-containing protein n=1 Tax=Deinococcus lacus TaxID=392561 RepID=A0ABW1YE83_9DEIO